MNMKDQFISKVDEMLTKLNFVKTENKYELNKVVSQPGQVIVINGQRMEQPGQSINIKYIINDLGEGYYSNPDDSNKVDLMFYKTEAYIQDQLEGEYSSGYSLDDFKRFESEMLNILRLR